MLGGTAVPRDVDEAPEGTHDFDIELPGDRTVALEVTTAAERSVISQRNAAFGREWTAPQLASNWWVNIGHSPGQEPVSIKSVMDGIVPLLETFERDGLTSVETHYSLRNLSPKPGTTQEVHGAMIEMFDLGVVAARTWGTPELGEEAAIWPSISSGVGSDTVKVNALVAERATPKRKKLVAAEADERHLFIWLDNSHADAELAVATLPPPSTPPAVPSGIDAVWLATVGSGPGVARLWRVRPPGPWEVLTPPAGYVLKL
jgi:hypothetical protein